MDLSKLELGPLDAEDDSSIENYFIQFGEYSELEKKKKYVMVGVKGSGKSAVRKFLSAQKRKEKKFVIEIDDSYSIPVEDLSNRSPFEIRNLLECFIIELIILSLLDNNSVNITEKGKLKTLEIPIIKKILENVEINIKQSVKISLADIFTKNQSEISKVLEEKTRDCILDVIKENEVWILIDDIHKVFSVDNNDSALRFIEGLIYLSSHLNIQHFKNKVNVVLFVRNEFYQDLLLSAEELDKEIQYIWHVKWNSTELIEFLSARIKWFLSEKLDSSLEIWGKLFDVKKKEKITEIQDYLIERVVNGPRDLLLLVKYAQKKAINNKSSKIKLQDIKEAEYEYGEEKLLQINRSFIRIYDGIKLIIEKYFRGYENIFTRESLESYISKIIVEESSIDWIRKSSKFTFLKILYKIGFLGYFSSSSGRYLYSIEQPEMEQTSKDTKLKIHEAFASYLELI